MTYRIPGEDEVLRGDATLPSGGLRAVDFWRWAVSDVCEDSVKGYFAEWLVATLLGRSVAVERRISYATCDVITPTNLRIEVKATSYWQSWRVFDEHGRPRAEPTSCKKIAFRVAPTRNSAELSNAAEPKYHADFYVFCFEHEENLLQWNPFELGQWEFYYLSQAELRDLRRTTIPLPFLRNIFMQMHQAPNGLTARQLQEHFQRIHESARSDANDPLAGC